jgi:RimJ/RimL family protein N-acetyltransferase
MARQTPFPLNVKSVEQIAMQQIQTSRLRLRAITSKDAGFILKLVNDPDWLKYIGQRNIHTIEDAQNYIQSGPQLMYQQHGLGLMLVESTQQNAAIGLCGLLKRDELPHPDLGFAFLPEYRQQGFAQEAAEMVLIDALTRNLSPTILAITSADNKKSIQLLNRLNFINRGVSDTMPDTIVFELVNASSKSALL